LSLTCPKRFPPMPFRQRHFEGAQGSRLKVSNKYTDAVFKTTFPDTTVSIGNQPPKKIKGLTIKAIAYALAWRTNERGYCWPSYKRIAKDACCDYMTAVRGVRALLKLQVIGEFPSTRSRYDTRGTTAEATLPKNPICTSCGLT